MKKEITVQQYRTAVRVAQACDPLITKKNNVKAKMQKLQEEVEEYQAQIDALDAGIRKIIGFPVEALVKKTITPGVDGNGKAIKTTKYVPTDIVSYNEETKKYEIIVDEPCCQASSEEAPDAVPEVEDEKESNDALNW